MADGKTEKKNSWLNSGSFRGFLGSWCEWTSVSWASLWGSSDFVN